MKTLGIIISIILMAISLILSVVVLLQQGKSAGLGAISGGNSDTYFGRNKNRTVEGKLNLLTKICGAAFMVASLVLYFIVAAIG